jgi:hypothetical protein
MTRQRTVQYSMAGIAIVALGVAIWLLPSRTPDQPTGGSPRSLAPTAAAERPAESVAAAPSAGPPAAALAAPPAVTGTAPPPPPPRKIVQNREVPLAKLPPEIYQATAKRGLDAAPADPPRRTTLGSIFGFGLPPAPPATQAAKVSDPLTAARTRLSHDPALTDWFDQWQADHAAERPTPPARAAELQPLLEKTPVPTEDLAAVATAVAKAEGTATPTARAWLAAALDRAQRDLKADPQNPERARRLDQLRAAAAKPQ